MGNLEKIHDNAAGIDIGSEKIFVATDKQPVKSYRTFTNTLQECVKNLQSQNIRTVAMEATGVYWITIYDMLEKVGMDVWLVNPADSKNLPGRKTDVQDCQWIQQLHSFGLLRRSFIPKEVFRQLRTYNRLREDHIQMASSHIQHMQKALISMNIRLPEVLSQVHGKSGMLMIESILSGNTDAKHLLSLCDFRLRKNKGEEILQALQGFYSEEHLFELKQAYDAYYFYQKQIQDCDKKMEIILEKMSSENSISDEEILQKANKETKRVRHHNPQIDKLHYKLIRITEGRDATTLPGFTDYNYLRVLSELGNDISRWPTEKHFTSWLGLAPGQNRSGKINKRTKKRSSTKAGQVFKQAAQTLLISKHIALGAFAKRIKAKRGPAIAIKATARKLAVMYYNLMKYGADYVEAGTKKYEEKYRSQLIKFMQKKAAELNLQVIDIQ